ncbi:MAG TPA: zinc metalloprotease HtpX [Longimicrobium sp.]|nr:zinc metalloprotease HtpX [Longimicrobium sp.]
MNNVRVFVLMAGLTALLGALGNVLGGQSGLVMALLLAVGMNFFAYFASAAMVLRMYGARTVGPAEAPELYEMVDRLRQRAGLPMPTVAVAPHLQPNAFATGRDPQHAVVCVTEGILRTVNRDELEGVIAHELAHIKNRDMLLMTVAATLAGAISNLAHFGFFFGGGDRDNRNVHPFAAIAMLLLAPMAAMLIQLAVSRQREFKADAVAAGITGRPVALANALRKLEAGAHAIPMDVSPAVAPLAQVNPLSALRGGGLTKLFSTHPPMAERIARLEALAA